MQVWDKSAECPGNCEKVKIKLYQYFFKTTIFCWIQKRNIAKQILLNLKRLYFGFFKKGQSLKIFNGQFNLN